MRRLMARRAEDQANDKCEPDDWMTQDEMAYAENGERGHHCGQGVELCSQRQDENAGEEPTNGNHAEQAGLGKYVKQRAVSFERSRKQPIIGDIRLLEMRAGPEAERPGFQPAMQRILPELQSQ